MNTCERCNGTGLEDSGAIRPWGEKILVECECRLKERDMDELRKQFEGWGESHFGAFWPYFIDTFVNNGKYTHASIDSAWEGWQASRAAIEIELPEACSCCYSESEKELHDSAMDEVADILRAAGIKVKE